MRISKISYEMRAFNNVHKQNLLQNKNYNIDLIKYLNNLQKRDIVSFSSNKTFSETLKENYYKLPAGCFPDNFQIESGRALYDGHDVLVEAPTGTGKTAIARYAATRNMELGKKTFYTTPLKALSNQKLNEFKEAYGEENIGILTGDRRENADAPIVIMTTEVYRNMALSNMYGEKNPIMDNLGTVIFDEFHYLGDPERGPVWEESLMYTPKGVQTLELSATIGNSEKLKKWIGSLDNNNAVLVTMPAEQRFVPLEFGMLETGAYKAEEKRIDRNLLKKGYVPESDAQTVSKPVLSDFKLAVNSLKEADKLPAIFFVFSRKFSRELLNYFTEEGKPLTNSKEQEEIKKIINEHKSKKYLGSDLNEEALKNGYSIHNAGIIPAQKELIEELFQKKLLKVVIATETLAAGINMPARSVVISNPYKPTDNNNKENEEKVRLLTSNEFKQMAGRAGRRGIDKKGYVYTMPTDKLTEQDFLVLEALPSNPIESGYNPDYAFLSGFYEHNNNPEGLKDIYNKSFYAFDETDNKEKSTYLMNVSRAKTNVLLNRGFLEKNENGYNPTQLGKMASVVRGYDALTLVETVAEHDFENITPETLAAIAGIIANPARSNETEIGTGSDLSSVIEPVNIYLDKIHAKITSQITAKLKKLGADNAIFTSYDEMLNFAQNIQKPDKEEDVLLKELKNQEKIRNKMYTITAESGSYTNETLAEALKNGDVIPSTVLEKYSKALEDYKKRIHTDDIDEYIEKLKNDYDSVDSSSKGNKVKARLEKEKQEIGKQIAQAKVMKVMDEKIPDAIASNYQFIKNNQPAEVKRNYKNAELAYTKATAKDELISQIQAVKSIEEYSKKHNINAENLSNLGAVGSLSDKIINKALEVRETELNNGINNYPERYAKNILQFVFLWSYLNKVNEGSKYNWLELIKELPEGMDEGGTYRIMTQTADLLSQIGEIASVGEKTSISQNDIEYYSNLKNTAIQARKLLIKDPVTLN